MLGGVDEPFDRVHHVHGRRRGHGSRGRVLVHVEDLQHEPYRSHTVGHRVVELHDESALAVREVLHQDAFPQRTGPVEALHGGGSGHLHDVGQLALAGRAGEAQVVAEVEVRIDLPTRRRGRHRTVRHALAQAGDDATGPLEHAPEVFPFDRSVDDDQRGDRRTQQRVLLDGPHQRVGVAHATLVDDGAFFDLVGHTVSSAGPRPGQWRHPRTRRVGRVGRSSTESSRRLSRPSCSPRSCSSRSSPACRCGRRRRSWSARW